MFVKFYELFQNMGVLFSAWFILLGALLTIFNALKAQTRTLSTVLTTMKVYKFSVDIEKNIYLMV